MTEAARWYEGHRPGLDEAVARIAEMPRMSARYGMWQMNRFADGQCDASRTTSSTSSYPIGSKFWPALSCRVRRRGRPKRLGSVPNTTKGRSERAVARSAAAPCWAARVSRTRR
jgi:hypothetical protein